MEPQLPRPDPHRKRNSLAGLLACGVAAFVGALAWGALGHFAEIEHGVLAWGIGWLIGIACAMAGGRGQGMAVTAMAFTVLSLLGGKWFHYDWDWSLVAEDPAARADWEASRAADPAGTPDWEVWILNVEETARHQPGRSFADWLMADIHLFDVLFLVLGLFMAWSTVRQTRAP